MQVKRWRVRVLVMFGLAASMLIGGLAAVAGEGDNSTVAGNGTEAFAGDGGQATSGSLDFPTGVDVTGGVLLITDFEQQPNPPSGPVHRRNQHDRGDRNREQWCRRE